MYAANFRYYSPETVSDAAEILKEHGESARILAGGMSLIPMMKMRLMPAGHIVDLGRISELKGITENGQNLRIGAVTTHHAIETSDMVKKQVPLLSEVASWIGDPQVRNRGTIGGALSHADPSGDWGAALLALKGKVELSDGKSKRIVEGEDFFVDLFETSMKPGEILTSVLFQKYSGDGSGFSYMKMERKAGDFATVGVAAQILLDKAGNCTYAGIGLTAMGRTPVRAAKSENHLRGKKPDDSVIDEAAEKAVEDSDPSDDTLRGSAEFKRDMCRVFAKRAIRTAVERAGGRL